MIYRLIAYAFVLATAYFASIKWQHTFKYEDFKDYLALISAVSGMVFTIMGIWIAFLYPNAMSRIVSKDNLVVADFSESKSDAKRLESIVGAVMSSALVMILALFITLSKIIFFTTPLYDLYQMYFKSAALSVLILMTLMQLESVVYVVLSNIIFINDLHFRRQARQSDMDL